MIIWRKEILIFGELWKWCFQFWAHLNMKKTNVYLMFRNTKQIHKNRHHMKVTWPMYGCNLVMPQCFTTNAISDCQMDGKSISINCQTQIWPKTAECDMLYGSSSRAHEFYEKYCFFLSISCQNLILSVNFNIFYFNNDIFFCVRTFKICLVFRNFFLPFYLIHSFID